MINIKNPPGAICIGRKGENGVMDIPFDMAAWYALWPDISIAVFHKRPGEMQAYPVVIERKGESVEWTVSAADTAISGRGSLEILGTVEDKRKLSLVMTTYISDSILDNTGDAPEAVRPWVDEVLSAADRAEAAAKRAESAGGGSVTPEQIQQAVDNYLSKNPVEIEESDPTVPTWAKQPEKPKYNAEEVGAQPKGDYALKSEIPSVPVQSVNGKTGDVKLNAQDVGALPVDTKIPAPYTLPVASADTLGGVKVGKGVAITEDGELNVIGGRIELVWENAAPNDYFYEQTVPMDLSNTDAIYIYVRNERGGSYFLTYGAYPLDQESSLERYYASYNSNISRKFTPSATGITFKDNNKDTGYFMIPIKVWAVKTR